MNKYGEYMKYMIIYFLYIYLIIYLYDYILSVFFKMIRFAMSWKWQIESFPTFFEYSTVEDSYFIKEFSSDL